MFVLNPGATSEVQLKMMEFLGALFGMSIRSGILLDLNISRFVWKQIAGDEVTMEDLRFIDDLYVKDLDNLLAKSKELTDEQFTLEFGETHTMSTMLSDNRVVDIVENGRNIPVTRASAQQFYDGALQARLSECKPQVQALVAGIDKTFDRKILRLINWKYLEYKVVGLNEVSVERLKEITAYRNCSDTHEVIKRFWTVLDGFTNEDKISYLRFVWGRTRLPLKEEEGVENHTI
jgi:E3 ubiquitin-protein ligase HECTD3